MKILMERAKKILSIDSVTQNGNEELANYLAGLMQESGFKVQLQPVTHSLDGFSKRQFNLIGILGDPLVDRKTKKGLLLNTHLDTVGPGLMQNWTECAGNPFAATIKDGKIFGLGSADVKLDFLCKLNAAEKFRERALRQPIYMVGTCGEEVGMFGAKYLIKSGALNPRYVMVGEPSDLKLVYAHKCLNMFRISIEFQLIEKDARGFTRRAEIKSFGKSAHGSYPHLGMNAIEQLYDFMAQALESGFEFRTVSMQGGDTKKKVPDSSGIEFYLATHQYEDFKRYFKERSAQMPGQFTLELGNLGEAGVRFLPEDLFSAQLDILDFFRDLGHSLKGQKDPSYNPPYSTSNFAMLVPRKTGVDHFFDLRLLPEIDPAEMEKRIKQGIAKIAEKYPSLNLTCVRERMNPGLGMTAEHDLVKHARDAMKAAGIEPTLDKKATSTEAAQYFAAGFEAVVFGPGLSMGNSHSPNENCSIDQLEKACLFYEK